MPEDVTPPEPIQATPSAPEPAQVVSSPAPARPASLVDQYEFGDTEHSAELDERAQTPVVAAGDGPTSPASIPTPATITPPQQSPRLLRMAEDLGIPKEDTAGLNRDQLEALIYQVNKHNLRLAREHGTQEALQRVQDRSPVRPAEEPPPPPDDLGIDEAQFDPGLVGALKKQTERLARLEKELAGYRQEAAFNRQMSTADQLDSLFARQEKSVFGEGLGREMQRESPEFLRRMAVLTAMDRMTKGTLTERFTKAVTTLFGSKAPAPVVEREEAADTELENRRRDWNGAGLARPTQRAGAGEAKGDKKAMQTAARILRERGLTDDDDLPADAFPE